MDKYILSWQVNDQGPNVVQVFTKGRPQTLEGVKKSLAGFLGWNAEKSSDSLDKAVSKLLTTGLLIDIQAADWVPCYQRPLKYSFQLEPWDGSQDYILTFEGQSHGLPFGHFTGTLEQAIEQAERSAAEYRLGEPNDTEVRWFVKECRLTEYGPCWEVVTHSYDPAITGRRGGKKGGAARTEKKAAAAAENGQKGGRPKAQPVIHVSISCQNGEGLSEAEKEFIADQIMSVLTIKEQNEIAALLDALAVEPEDEQPILNRLDELRYGALKVALKRAGKKFDWLCDPMIFLSVIVETWVIKTDATAANVGSPRKVQEVCKCEKCGASTGIDANAKYCFACELEAKREAIERKEAEEAEDREWLAEYNSPTGKAYRKEQKKLGKK